VKRFTLLLTLAAVALAGCSAGKPSSKDAERATMELFRSSGFGFSYVDDFTVAGCVEARVGDGVNCDVSGTFVMEEMGRRFPVAMNRNLRFSKAGGDWRAFIQ